MTISRTLIATFVLLILSPLSSFAAMRAGTVVLDNGRRLVDAEYKIVSMYKIVEVVSIEGVKVKLKYSFSKISALLDEDGYDVTEKYLGKFAVRKSSPNPATEEPEKKVETAEVIKPIQESAPDDTAQITTSGEFQSMPATASSDKETAGATNSLVKEPKQTKPATSKQKTSGQDWRTNLERERVLRPSYRKLHDIGFRLGGNFSYPTGFFYEGITSGAGFGGDVIIPVSFNIALRGSISRSGMKWDDDYRFFSGDPDIVFISQDNSITATRYSASVEFYFFNREGVFPPKVVGFAYSGLGAIAHTITSTITARRNSTGQVATASIASPFTEFIGVSGVGVDLMMNPNFGFEAAVNLDVVVLGSNGGSEAQYAYVFDLRLGVVSFF